MWKRLVIGLLSAGLVGAMLPGIAGAAPNLVSGCHFPDHRGDYLLEPGGAIAECESSGGTVFRMGATAADKVHLDPLVWVCHFPPDHWNTDPDTWDIQAGDFIFRGPENITACKYYKNSGAEVLRMRYTDAVAQHTDNEPGP